MPQRKANIEDVRASIDATLRVLEQREGRLPVPIDLGEVCRTIGVEWEFRWMIPEGVTAVVDDKLKIFIRNNFSEQQGLDKRQRFTWAHEICHVLLYDLSCKPPKPAEDAPKDKYLESLCQNGAGYLLMPTSEIRRIFRLSQPIGTVDDVVALSNQFGASFEVVVRRLKQESSCLRANYALVLFRSSDGENPIVAAAYDSWLRTILPNPVPGQNLKTWGKAFCDQASQTGPDEWEKGRVKMSLVPISRSLTIAEIKQT